METPGLSKLTRKIKAHYPKSTVTLIWNGWGAKNARHLMSQTSGGLNEVSLSIDGFHAAAIADRLEELGRPHSSIDVDRFLLKRITWLLKAGQKKGFQVEFNGVESDGLEHYVELVEKAHASLGRKYAREKFFRRARLPGGYATNKTDVYGDLHIGYDGKLSRKFPG